jgi:hypothetical protein
MEKVLIHLPVNGYDRARRMAPGCYVILDGDFPAWKYCKVLCQVLTRCPMLVAVATEGRVPGSYHAVVVYSHDEDYPVGSLFGREPCDVITQQENESRYFQDSGEFVARFDSPQVKAIRKVIEENTTGSGRNVLLAALDRAMASVQYSEWLQEGREENE